MPNSCIRLEILKETFDYSFITEMSGSSSNNSFKIGCSKNYFDSDYFDSAFVSDGFADYFKKIKETVERCNCENAEDLKRRIGELGIKNDILEDECINYESERDDWKTKYYDKNRDYEEEKEKNERIQKELDRLKNERLGEIRKNNDEKLSLQGTITTLRVEKTRAEGQRDAASNQVIDLTRRLENKEEEVSLVRREKENQLITFENKLDQKQQLLENVRQSLKDLEIKSEREKGEKNAEVKEKESELRAKEDELKRKEEEIKKITQSKRIISWRIVEWKTTFRKRKFKTSCYRTEN